MFYFFCEKIAFLAAGAGGGVVESFSCYYLINQYRRKTISNIGFPEEIGNEWNVILKEIACVFFTQKMLQFRVILVSA